MIRTVLSVLLLGASLSLPGVADSVTDKSTSATGSGTSPLTSPARPDKPKASPAATCRPVAVRRRGPVQRTARKKSVSAAKSTPAPKAVSTSAVLAQIATPLPAALVTPVPVVLPVKAKIEPRIASVPLDSYVVTDVHLRPLFTTTIRLPESATSIAVGAPTMFLAEHSDDDPRLVFVKPSTHEPAESNLLIALQSGETISLRLISPGDAGSRDNVDFVLDYRSGKRLLMFADDIGISAPKTTSPIGHPSKLFAASSQPFTTPSVQEQPIITGIDGALFRQAVIPAPRWSTVEDLAKLIRANEKAPHTLVVSLGQVVQEGDSMIVSYSILNIGNQWVQILPPQIQLADPTQKKNKKKKGALAEQVPTQDYRLNVVKLSPGARTDGAVKFSRPGFKQSRERLLLQLATASAVDTPMLIPIPFVAPGS